MHTARCSDSTSARCKCDCGGAVHGTRPGPVYRWAVESVAATVDPDPALVNGVYQGVIDVVVELERRSPHDMAAIAKAVEEELSGQAWTLLLDKKPPKRRMGRRHWLCTILADIAAMLGELADLPGAVGDAVREACQRDGWGELRSRVAGELVERLAQLAFAQTLEPVSVLALKIKVAALMVCPDPENHQEVMQAFASDIGDAMGMEN